MPSLFDNIKTNKKVITTALVVVIFFIVLIWYFTRKSNTISESSVTPAVTPVVTPLKCAWTGPLKGYQAYNGAPGDTTGVHKVVLDAQMDCEKNPGCNAIVYSDYMGGWGLRGGGPVADASDPSYIAYGKGTCTTI